MLICEESRKIALGYQKRYSSRDCSAARLSSLKKYLCCTSAGGREEEKKKKDRGIAV
jgi:hypothetical protein